jgi:hypothetical protein
MKAHIAVSCYISTFFAYIYTYIYTGIISLHLSSAGGHVIKKSVLLLVYMQQGPSETVEEEKESHTSFLFPVLNFF